MLLIEGSIVLAGRTLIASLPEVCRYCTVEKLLSALVLRERDDCEYARMSSVISKLPFARLTKLGSLCLCLTSENRAVHLHIARRFIFCRITGETCRASRSDLSLTCRLFFFFSSSSSFFSYSSTNYRCPRDHKSLQY